MRKHSLLCRKIQVLKTYLNCREFAHRRLNANLNVFSKGSMQETDVDLITSGSEYYSAYIAAFAFMD